MCSWTYVTSSCRFTSLGFNSGDVHLFSCTKINHHLVRIIRTLCRDRQKRFVFVHTFYTQYAFVIILGHECLRVAQTFWCEMFVYENSIFYTHTFIHTLSTNISHTQIQTTKCLRKDTVDILSLASTFGCSRHKTNKSYFRIILVNGFMELFVFTRTKRILCFRTFRIKLVNGFPESNFLVQKYISIFCTPELI